MARSLRSLFVPFLLLAFLVALAAPARATTIRVPADQPTIQQGIDAAAVGDTVLVGPGTYSGAGNRDLDLHGRDIVVRSSDGPGSTIIDCELAGRGFYLHSGETPAAIIQGFDIRRGSADDPGGGGILCDGASPLIDDCHINECRGYQSGGGVLLLNSEAELRNSSISTCTSDWRGGGMAIMEAGRVEIANCLFQENSARASGGGVYISDVDEVVVTHCSLVSNSAAEWWDFGYGEASSASQRAHSS